MNGKRVEAAVKKVVRFLRVSGPEQETGLEHQHAQCDAIIAKHGLRAEWDIRIDGVSGAVVMQSPAIKYLITILESGQCAGVVMFEASRLMRPDNYGDLFIAQVFKENRVQLYTPDTVYDLSNPDHSLLFAVQMAISANERTKIRARTYGRRCQIRSQGKHASGANSLTPGIGYDPEREVFFPDDTHGQLTKVQRAFEMVLSGTANFRKIAAATGLSYFSVGNVLRRTDYIGIRTYSERRDPKTNVYDAEGHLRYSKKVALAPEEVERVPMCGFRAEPKLYPLPVSEQDFYQVQKILAIKREQDWRGGRRAPEDDPFLFRGFLRCACDDALVIPIAAGERQYYVCRNVHGDRRVRADASVDWRIQNNTCATARMRRDVLEPLLERTIREKLSDAEFLWCAMLSHRKTLESGASQSRAAGMRREIAEMEAEQKRLTVLFRKGRISEQELDLEDGKLGSALEAARKALAACTPYVPKISPERLVEIVAPFRTWDTLTVTRRRALLSAVCPVITVAGRGNGGIGAGARTQVTIEACRLALTPSGAPEAVKRAVNIGDSEWRNSESPWSTVLPIDPLIYVPLDPSIWSQSHGNGIRV